MGSLVELMDAFYNARVNAKPDCEKCHGTGSYMYDHNHGTVCYRCCRHNMGWWLLEQYYGTSNGNWCCRAGCGLELGFNPDEL